MIQVSRFVLILFLAQVCFSAEEKLGSLMMPKELELSEIEDKAGAKIPLDVRMINHLGQEVLLSDYFADTPVIVTLGYNKCQMLCSLVLNALVKGLKNLNYKLGKDFRIVSASIDPNDKVDVAYKKRANYIESLGASSIKDEDWSFNIMTENEAKRLSAALGFNYFYDVKSKQYAHGAGIFVLSKNGVLSRTLFGLDYKPSDLKLALSEASEGKIGSFVDRVLLSCFHYDPDSHKYGIYIMGVMRLCGVVTVLVIAAFLLVFFRREKRHLKAL